MNFSFLPFRGTWVDIILLLVMLYYIWEGVERGLLLGFVELAGFVVSFVFAVRLYPLIAHLIVQYVSLSVGIANAIGFLVGGFIIQLIFSFLLSLLYRRIPVGIRRAKWNKWLGWLPGIGNGALLAAFILMLLLSLPIQGGVKSAILNGYLSSRLVIHSQGVEHELKTIFGDAVNETLTFFTINPKSGERVDLHFTQHDLHDSPMDETQMLVLVNDERKKVGLSALHADPALQPVARAHARDMFERGYFSHYTPEGVSPFDRMHTAGILFTAAGENLALAPSVQLAHQGLMNSPGHRANILSADFHRVGIGVVDGGVYGIMFVQEFRD